MYAEHLILLFSDKAVHSPFPRLDTDPTVHSPCPRLDTNPTLKEIYANLQLTNMLCSLKCVCNLNIDKLNFFHKILC
jgi:hypothetical protein